MNHVDREPAPATGTTLALGPPRRQVARIAGLANQRVPTSLPFAQARLLSTMEGPSKAVPGKPDLAAITTARNRRWASPVRQARGRRAGPAAPSIPTTPRVAGHPAGHPALAQVRAGPRQRHRPVAWQLSTAPTGIPWRPPSRWSRGLLGRTLTVTARGWDPSALSAATVERVNPLRCRYPSAAPADPWPVLVLKTCRSSCEHSRSR
ncbi:hypothetical protein MAUB1S_04207 [Mycolicibacterium aubagnense]